jgi:predicted DNA-binding transcriptional regulator YafY
LRRDVDRLRELGYPVEARRGVDGGYQLAAGAVLPPLVLDDDEAIALAVGLQAAIQSGTVSGIEESSARAFAKIVQVMPTRLRRRVDALAAMTVPAPWDGAGPVVDPSVLSSVALACRDGDHLAFTYTDREGEHSSRRVEPHRLVLLGRRWYLVAWDLVRFDWRSFRLDRLTEPHRTVAHFPARVLPAGDAAAFVRAGIDQLPVRHVVDAVVHAPAEDVRARVGRWGDVEDLGAQRCRLRMTGDSTDWLLMALGATGSDFEVVAPPEMVEHVRRWAARFGRAAPVPGSPRGRRAPTTEEPRPPPT